MEQFQVFKAWVQARLALKGDRGANLVEYVFLLTFIALVVILIVTNLGKEVSEKFGSASSTLNG
jgi:Flp pilus assembly pilin Flp